MPPCPLLIDMLKDKTNPLARLHALWALAALNGLNAAVLNHVVGDPHPALRENALRVAAVIEPHACETTHRDGAPGQAC